MANMRWERFFVGGAYAGPADAQVMHGQMHVEMLTPDERRHPWPLVFIHGAAQTGIGWITTPDGREGWAPWFAQRGWRVCVVDQPARGRSAWRPDLDGGLTSIPVGQTENLFTAPERNPGWPQAVLHTQWPGGAGKGRAGDPVFDQFYASQVPSLTNPESESLMRAAGAALLDRIGPAVLITHSQAGLFGWLIADARPGLVKGIVALEPAGPPYKDTLFPSGFDRAFGLTSLPLTYEPAVTAEAPLAFEQQDGCWLQKGAARRLVHLAGVPTAVVTSEASYHAEYDHCTVAYLHQAGVDAEFIRLADRGIHGNGHMMMLEKNSLDIATCVEQWLIANIGTSTEALCKAGPVAPASSPL
jgi:pimeloyl-ACP methyl ester carboxylesterase